VFFIVCQKGSEKFAIPPLQTLCLIFSYHGKGQASQMHCAKGCSDCHGVGS
jgi:hypothetical protein